MESLPKKENTHVKFKNVFSGVKMKCIIFSDALFHFISVALSYFSEKKFDEKHGIETLKIERNIDENIDGCPYEPTPAKIFYKTMKTIEANENDYFIDFGAGKGKVLFMAAEFGIKNIVGVEISKEIYKVAQKNIKNYLSSSRKDVDISVLNCDACDFVIPDNATIFYFFHPFYINSMKEVLKNIEQSFERSPRALKIVYYYPLSDIKNLFNSQKWLKKKFTIKYKKFLPSIDDYCVVYEAIV
ncbi:MAG: class I SAM-dependent methyltransferase [Clostridia bacterium]|nr:class I SAM-dependent methyltransferase [Clostridia bacterium]